MKATLTTLNKMKGGDTIFVVGDGSDAYTKVPSGIYAGLFESHLYFGELYDAEALALQMGDTECEIIKGREKEEKEMKKFEIGKVEYGFNEETGRYSKTENGKTKRIGKAEYEEAASTPYNVKKIPCESGDHMVELANIGLEYGIRFVGEDEYKPFDKSEFKNEVDPRDREFGRFEVSFEYMGRRYWLKDAVTKSTTTKSRKKRTPKSVAYKNEKLDITLTEKQLDFCRHMPDTCFWEKGLDSTPWVDVLCDEIGGQFADKPMTIGAMVSTLREKGVIGVDTDTVNGRKAKYLYLTKEGKEIFKDLNIGC